MSASTALETAFLTPPDLAKRWRVSTGHLSNLRYAAKGPEYIKLNGGRVLYALETIERYEAERVVRPLEARG